MKRILRTEPKIEPRNPDWERDLRDSFERQGAMKLIGASLGEMRPGYVEVVLPFRPDLTQQDGFFHAGITSTAVDTAGGFAAFSIMPAACRVLSVEFKLNLLAPADGDEMIAEGHVLKSGKLLIITRGEVYVRKGDKLAHCATMQQTLMTMYPNDREMVSGKQ
jgi:uncharacterized protein (TIGR00369 family)